MIEIITWKQILPIWQKHLWPHRTTPVEQTSAMMWLTGYNMLNMSMDVTYFGYFKNNKLVGVNSGHNCVSSQWPESDYRSRGLWVHPKHRGQGIGQALLTATINRGLELGNTMIWSYPRFTSWKTYESVGFKLDTDWEETENGKNAYCSFVKT